MSLENGSAATSAHTNSKEKEMCTSSEVATENRHILLHNVPEATGGGGGGGGQLPLLSEVNSQHFSNFFSDVRDKNDFMQPPQNLWASADHAPNHKIQTFDG